MTNTAGVSVPAVPLAGFQVDLPKTFLVTTLADGGPGSLGEAIVRANAFQPSGNTIAFDPALFAAGPAMIVTSSGLPIVSSSMTIVGPGSGLLTIRLATGAFRPFSVAGLRPQHAAGECERVDPVERRRRHLSPERRPHTDGRDGQQQPRQHQQLYPGRDHRDLRPHRQHARHESLPGHRELGWDAP